MKFFALIFLLLTGCEVTPSYQGRPSEIKAGITACASHQGVLHHQIDGYYSSYNVYCVDGTNIEGAVQ